MALPATDTFTAANGTALATYSASWTQNQGAMDIQSNGVHPNSATAYSMAHWNADTFSPDQYAQVTIAALVATTNMGPAVRVAASGHTGYAFMTIGTAIALERWVAGAKVQLATLTFTVGAGDVMRIEIRGESIVGKVNGIIKLAASNSAITSGFAGIDGWNNTAGNRMDNWEGGDMPRLEATHQGGRPSKNDRRKR